MAEQALILTALFIGLLFHSGSSQSNEFNEDFGKAINKLRAEHQAGPVRFSKEMLQKAHKCATNLASGKSGGGSRALAYEVIQEYELSPLLLAHGVESSKSPEDFVDLWRNQENYYNYTAGMPKCGPKKAQLSFTAVVWKSSTRFGCSTKVRPTPNLFYKEEKYICCKLNKRANKGTPEVFKKNVLPKIENSGDE